MKQRIRFLLIIIATLCLLTLAGSSSYAAQSKLDEVIKRGYVKVGVTNAAPPFGFRDEKGELVGFDVDMGKALAEALFEDPKKVEFVVEKEDARIPNLLANKVDVVIQFMSVTPQRATLVEFTDPYYESWLGLVVRADAPYKSPEDLAGKKISMLQNVYAADLVHTAVPTAEVVEYDTNTAAVLALQSGRVDGNMNDLPCIYYMMKYTNPGQFKLLPGKYTPQNFGMAVRPGDYRWLQFLNTFVQELTHGTMYDSHYAPSYMKWFGVNPPNLFVSK